MLGCVPSTVEIIARFPCLCQLFFKVFAKFFLCKFFVFFAANLLTWQLLRAIIICVDRSGQQPNIGDLHSGSAVDSDSTCGGSIPSSPTKNHSQTRMVFLFFRPHFSAAKSSGHFGNACFQSARCLAFLAQSRPQSDTHRMSLPGILTDTGP